jgi:hypothetical protein
MERTTGDGDRSAASQAVVVTLPLLILCGVLCLSQGRYGRHRY